MKSLHSKEQGNFVKKRKVLNMRQVETQVPSVQLILQKWMEMEKCMQNLRKMKKAESLNANQAEDLREPESVDLPCWAGTSCSRPSFSIAGVAEFGNQNFLP